MASAVCFPKSESVGESAVSTVETCNVTIQREGCLELDSLIEVGC
jgi:hypothetical protein